MPQQDLIPFEFQAGIDKDRTPYEVGLGFIDANNVRFRLNKPEKIGGWTLYTPEVVDGTARDILSWVALDSNTYLAVATHKRVEIFLNNLFYDITPLQSTLSTTDAIDVSSGNTYVTLTYPLHGVAAGDTFVFTSAPTTVGGNVVLTGDYVITTVPDSNHIVFETGIVATDTSISAGGPFTGGIILIDGLEYNQTGSGYGSGSYGSGTYGTGGSGTVLLPLREWKLENYGEDLLMNPRGGRIYVWTVSGGVGQRATVISASPSVNNFMLLTPTTRQVMSFGCTNEAGVYDPLTYRWSDQENYNGWATSATSQAGENRVDEGTQFIGAVASKGEIIAHTDTAAYRIYNTGNVQTGWTQELLSKNSGLIAEHASAEVNGVVTWMGLNDFFNYDGTVKNIPNGLSNTLFSSQTDDSIELTQKEMIFAGINKLFHEIIWLYPSRGNIYCNRYVIYNYLEGSIYDGDMNRSVWLDSNVFSNPLAISREGVVYQHEDGYNNVNAPLSAFIESGIWDINQGKTISFIDKFVPDMDLQGNSGHTITINTKNYPSDTTTTSKTYTVLQNSGKVSVRARGRQMGIQWDSNGLDSYFRFGKPRFAISPDGER